MLLISISLIEDDVDSLTRGIKGFPVTPDKQIQCEKGCAVHCNYNC